MMASKTFSGQLDQAMDELAAEGNKILFIPQQNVGEVLEGAASEMTVESDGTYSIKLAYNTYSIYHYSDVTKRKRLLADGIVVSSETSVTTIPGLIGSTVPVTEDSVLTIQGYLDEANEAKTDAETAQAATEALYEDFDSNVAGAMALVHTETPSLSAPFNESGRLDYGVGTEYVSGLPVYGVDFTRSTASTVANKSGVLETLAADEIGIGADGAWLHGAYTNEHPYGNNLYNWSGGVSSVTGSATYAGVTMYLVSDASTDSNASVRYDFSSTLSASTSYYLQFLVKNVDAEMSKISLQGAMDDVIEIDITWDETEIDTITDVHSYRKISDDVYLVVSESRLTSSTVGFVNNYVFPASFVTGGTSTGSIYVGAMMVIQSDTPKELPFILTDGSEESATTTSCTVPVGGNLPANGQPFTFVFDAEFPDSTDTFIVFTISSDVSGGAVLFRKYNGIVQWFHDGSDGTDANLTTSNTSYTVGRHRYSLSFDGDSFAMYCDGTLINSRTPDDFCWFDVAGYLYFSSSYNNQLKNFKILPYSASADEVKSWGAPK